MGFFGMHFRWSAIRLALGHIRNGQFLKVRDGRDVRKCKQGLDNEERDLIFKKQEVIPRA